MELSVRMQNNVSLVPEHSCVGDIGCDHGYASIYLCREKHCRVIAMDVNRGPLAIAEKNIAQAGLAEQIECRRSDGMAELIPGEVDTLLIAGMGGMLTTRILESHPEVLQEIDMLVLQPQSDFYAVRKSVFSRGFAITRETICRDGGKYYIAIQAVRSRGAGNQSGINQKTRTYTEAEYAFGRFLPEKNDRLYREYLLAEKAKTEHIQRELEEKEGASSHIQSRIQELSHTLELINQTLSGFKKYGGQK
ncbi:MAG: SAM-dependent methyltransferase [Lachnospiraceae bacterium]|nr:SAM-dependent methyltransferase [Lachnospiraceae bacterium]